ncbi:hypothetical protein [Pseudomonas oryzae]|uniref:Lipoprotein n=1 Tax=Pseudomonas oryzae TaxID=1392877 RepID=A0A1H1Q1E3_9PSED|nr:hypothetical protein [Pseudomonas oryzae]SDS17226.1 hypothetical protein SAMN05216221_1225 [Pseudomonas oryzae]
MYNVKAPPGTRQTADVVALSSQLVDPPLLCLRLLIVALLLSLAGCAGRERPPQPPPPHVSASTWRQIDSDIFAASLSASEQASSYAQQNMQRWMDLVYQRTEAEFIPWYSSYWTRQWLTMKVAWYKMNADGEKDPTVQRLAVYLQEQYHDLVLEPVARQVDPDQVMEQATRYYIQQLGLQVRKLPQRYGVPADQFDHHLQAIPAISLGSSSGGASLYQLVEAKRLDGMPAYEALIARIQQSPGRSKDWSSDPGISNVAQKTSESLVNELATSSVAGAISSAIGGAAGMALSLGTAGISAILREKERPKMESRLRNNLQAAFQEDWLNLMRNHENGVLAGVYHISGQIEGSLAASVARPLRYEPPSRSVAQPLRPQAQPVAPGIPQPAAPPVRYRTTDQGTPYQIW